MKGIVKESARRFGSLLLVVVLLFSLLPVIETPAKAADVALSGVPGLSASDANGKWTAGADGKSLNLSISTTVSSGCNGDSYTAVSDTLTLTNNSGATAVLSFDMSYSAGGGSVTLNNATPPSAYTALLADGESITIAAKTDSAGAGTTTVSLSNISLEAPQDVTSTFLKPVNGSYTVDGTAITADTQLTKNAAETFALAATPASGYRFFGWFNADTGASLSKSASVSLMFASPTRVEVRFVPSSLPTFLVGSEEFIDLNEATDYAVSSGESKIILVGSGTLPSGNYTIPKGKTLLIPYNDVNTDYTTMPGTTGLVAAARAYIVS